MLVLLLTLCAQAQDLLLVDVLHSLAVAHAEPVACRRALGPVARPDACELWVLHQLFTTSGPYNEAADGALGIPYFWPFGPEFVRPNIRRLADGARLGNLASDEEGESLAEVWRMPDEVLGDLAADEPRWSFRGRSFHSYGACAEREMATCLVARAWGHRAKVHLEGNHVQSWVWLGPELEVRLDTTFGAITGGPPLQGDPAAWQRDNGGSGRADPTCQSEAWLAAVREVEVSLDRAAEIGEAAARWFTR